MRTLTFVLASATLVACSTPSAVERLSAQGPDGGPPLEALRAEDLKGPDREARHARAAEAYGAKDWEEAARRYVAILEADPTDAIAWYNLACVFGLMGHAEQAADFLTGAWEAGFRNLDQIQTDPDFTRVREAPAFRDAVARLKAEQAGGPQVTRVIHEAQTVGEVLVIPPTPYEPGRRYPMLVALHGWGGEAAGFSRLLGRQEGQPFFLALPQAPYPVPGATGRSWFLVKQGEPRRPAFGSEARAEQSLMTAVDALVAEFPVDPHQVYLAGFSQGAYLALALGLHHPDRFRAVAPIGGWLDPTDHPRGAEGAATPPVLLLHAPDDQAVAFPEAEAARTWLGEHGVVVDLWTYEGGHVVSEAVRERIHAWVAAGGEVPAAAP